MASKKTESVIEIKPIDLRLFKIRLVGDSPLLMHCWSIKNKRIMLDKMMKKSSPGREAKDPWAEYLDSMYWLSPRPEQPTPEDLKSAKFGFPAVAFKSAAVSAGYRSGVTKDKVSSHGAFHIVGDMVEIFGQPEMREDMVRVGMGKADLRYRGEFKDWYADITIRYNASAMSAEQITNLLNLGGFAAGVGDWRPEKAGTFGMFHVE